MAGTLLFLEPDWPKRALRAVKELALRLKRPAAAHG
jgi:hypothetical protein